MGYIGLDIGASTIKAVELQFVENKTIIKHAQVISMPPDTIIDGTIIDYSEITKALSTIVTSGGFTTNEVALAVKGKDVLCKSVKIPYLNTQQLYNDVLYMAEQYIKVEPEEYSIDYTVQSIDPSTASAKIVYAAMNKADLVDYISIANGSGLAIQAVDMEVLAISKLYTFLKLPLEGVTCVIHTGHNTSLFIFFKDGHYVFHESSPIAGNYLNSLLISLAGVEPESVENIKISMPESNKNSDKDIKNVLYNNFIPELLKGYEHALSHYKMLDGYRPSDIYLSGGTVCIKGFAEHVNSLLIEENACLMSPVQSVEVESPAVIQILEQKPTALNVAIAMALRQ